MSKINRREISSVFFYEGVEMDDGLKQWRKDGKHLPYVLRDFHGQKDIFRAMHEMTEVDKNEYAKDISWVSGHCYVIDCFLWFMARHGYTLQRSRARIKFEDLGGNVEACNRHRQKMMGEAIGLTPIDSFGE